MNSQKVQQEITNIIDTYRKENPRFARKQYPAAKWQIEKLTELGLIEFMPAAPFSKTIGHTEADLVLKAVEDKASAVFNAYGEGEDVPASALNEAMSEDGDDDEPEADEADEALQELIDRVAAAEDAEYLEQAMITEERRMARDYDGVNLLTVEEVAEMKECHPETVRRALRSGEFERPRKVGNGLWLLDAREVANWQPRPVGRPAAQ